MVVTCRAQSQESNVPPGYGVGWCPPPGLGESVGIRNGLSWSEAGGLETNTTCREQSQELNVPLGCGVGWNPPLGQVESAWT